MAHCALVAVASVQIYFSVGVRQDVAGTDLNEVSGGVQAESALGVDAASGLQADNVTSTTDQRCQQFCSGFAADPRRAASVQQMLVSCQQEVESCRRMVLENPALGELLFATCDNGMEQLVADEVATIHQNLRETGATVLLSAGLGAAHLQNAVDLLSAGMVVANATQEQSESQSHFKFRAENAVKEMTYDIRTAQLAVLAVGLAIDAATGFATLGAGTLKAASIASLIGGASFSVSTSFDVDRLFVLKTYWWLYKERCGFDFSDAINELAESNTIKQQRFRTMGGVKKRQDHHAEVADSIQAVPSSLKKTRISPSMPFGRSN